MKTAHEVLNEMYLTLKSHFGELNTKTIESEELISRLDDKISDYEFQIQELKKQLKPNRFTRDEIVKIYDSFRGDEIAVKCLDILNELAKNDVCYGCMGTGVDMHEQKCINCSGKG